MAAAAPFLGVARHFVATEPRIGQHPLDEFAHVGREVLVGKVRWRPFGESRPLFDRELIKRKVRCGRIRRFPRFVAQHLKRLAREREHQVEIEIFENARRGGDGAPSARRIVNAPEALQALVRKTLNPERESIDTRRTEALELRFVRRAGVGFERDFGILRHGPDRAHAREKPLERLSRHEARRAAPEKDRFDGAAFGGLGPGGQVDEHRLDVARLVKTRGRPVRIEVAVRALAHAPGPVEIERHGRKARSFRLERLVRPVRLVHLVHLEALVDRPHHIHRARMSSAMAASARARWLTRFFSSAVSSAAVFPNSGT